MKLEQFQMERMQSTWENQVRYNLSESGVHPVKIGELIPRASDREALLDVELGYGQSNGTPDLRSLIASMYPCATQSNVMVTNGTSEANFLLSWMLTEPGDEAVMMAPNYMQLWGLLRGFGAEVKSFNLIEELNWAPDLDQLFGAKCPGHTGMLVPRPGMRTCGGGRFVRRFQSRRQVADVDSAFGGPRAGFLRPQALSAPRIPLG